MGETTQADAVIAKAAVGLIAESRAALRLPTGAKLSDVIAAVAAFEREWDAMDADLGPGFDDVSYRAVGETLLHAINAIRHGSMSHSSNSVASEQPCRVGATLSHSSNSVASEQPPAAAPLVVKGPWFDVPAGTRPAQCRSCHATVYWITTDSGKRMQVDCHVEGGTLPFKGVPGAGEADGRGISHFATCRDANTWRKRG